jgi:hypothetical protein
VFCRGRGFGLAAEDEAAALAAFVGGVVDLLPEGDEVVDGGDDGDDSHPVDGGNGDEVDADDVASPVPIIPAVSEDGSCRSRWLRW